MPDDPCICEYTHGDNPRCPIHGGDKMKDCDCKGGTHRDDCPVLIAHKRAMHPLAELDLPDGWDAKRLDRLAMSLAHGMRLLPEHHVIALLAYKLTKTTHAFRAASASAQRRRGEIERITGEPYRGLGKAPAAFTDRERDMIAFALHFAALNPEEDGEDTPPFTENDEGDFLALAERIQG